MRGVARGVVLGAIALMVIGGSVPASAKAPLKEIFTDEGWFTLPDIGCNGFTLTEVMDSEAITMTTFFNKTGDPMKIATRANLFGTITNTTSGHTFRDHASFTETINVPKGTTTVNGISYHYIVDGQGQVLMAGDLASLGRAAVALIYPQVARRRPLRTDTWAREAQTWLNALRPASVDRGRIGREQPQ